MNSTAVNNRVFDKMEVSSPKISYTQTNGTSLPLGQNRRPKSCRSPRPPPLISKFRGEPLSAFEEDIKPRIFAKNCIKTDLRGSPNRSTRISRAPYFIIHPEWASESSSISQLGTTTCSPLPIHNRIAQVTRSAHRRHQVATPSVEGNNHGILPADKGPEGVLSVARRAAACNPVWPHRCKSAPAQRTANPITWV